ncbi:uncharacterized protein LOC126808764 [Patella vulgata]|uniref:uncharacterized protein LOC126808764 n=1 Tax=Patella vulgata TaxID=6465 RepID=UPI0024A9567C|nr:uncharacterized protein LOC126808764 [Patella vulgata]
MLGLDQNEKSIGIKKEILIVLASETFTKRFRDFERAGEYNFHHLDITGVPLEFQHLTGDDSDFKFDIVRYIENAIEYVRNNEIDAVLGVEDIGDFVASIIREKTGLPGPGIETSFICLHKYYTRKYVGNDSNLWYIAVDLDSDDWKTQMQYPSYIKPPFLHSGHGQMKVNNELEMKEAVEKCRKFVVPWAAFYNAMFEKYLDISKFPLCVKNLVVAEHYVEKSDMMVSEGWVDGQGKYHVWQHADGLSYTKPFRSPFATSTPSHQPEVVLQKVEEYLTNVCKKLDLRSVFFNADLWIDHDQDYQNISVDIIEMNNRLSKGLHDVYKGLWEVSSFEAAMIVACGEEDVLPLSSRIKEHGYGGVIRVRTFASGPSTDILNFEEVHKFLDPSEGIKTEILRPGIDLSLREDEIFEQIDSNAGTLVGIFFVFQPTLSELKKRGDEVLQKILKKSCDHFNF